MVQTTKPNKQDGIFVEVRSGKGDSSSLYVDAIAFSYLDGLIWDKHREYGNKIKTKIHAAEWLRILDGFTKAAEKLDECKNECDLVDVLKFDLINPNHPLADVQSRTTDLATLIRAVQSFVSEKITTEKLVFIIQQVAR